ncbi:MAG: M48 family metalloprotease [Bacteroidales bacterium]|nr:M48 family metalloprotease [Bacteroidales bacterium]MCF8402681.1 M48 family metalloprotease [Bacteroidales bacterium]
MKKLSFALLIIIALSACSKKNDDTTINIFSINDDIELGNQLKAEIENNPSTYPLLNENAYPEAYYHLNRIRDSILNYGELKYADRFDWHIDIIQNDSVLNAFCAPGGYICVYTGIMKYLDNEAQLAGVMGHEMAHADRRHSTDQLTKAYGLQLLLSIVLGNNPNQLAEIAASLAAGVATLAFSRDAEYEADEYSVKYLYGSSYDARGVAGFFEKIGQAPVPEFLSTHPSPDNRVEEINAWWTSLGGKEGNWYEAGYSNIINSLP